MRKTITLLTILLLVVFMVGCENSINPMQSQTQNDNEGMILAKGGNKGGNTLDVPNPTFSIQDAIDAAADGEIIKIGAGTYLEALLIDGKNVSLVADGEVIIDPPGVGTFAIQAYNGEVSLSGFTVNATDYVLGIYAKGGMSGLGAVSLTVTNCTVFNYEKNGITVNGPSAYGHITDNDVDGNGPQGVPYFAQNGIQFGYGAFGKVMKNNVTGNLYTGPDWGASGILLFETDEVTVQKNMVEECGMGIAVETWGRTAQTASYNRIVQNTINECDYGVSIAAYAWGPSTMDCFAVNNKVINNSITSEDGEVGIGFYLWDEVIGGFTPTVDNNKMIHNTIAGFGEAVYYADGSINDKVHANVYE